MSPPTGPSWREEGTDADYRFSLANERTMLAWLRTALAMLAGAAGLLQLTALRGGRLRGTLAMLLAVSGLLLSATAYRRWASNEQAMRHGRALEFNPAVTVLAVAVTLGAALIVVLAVIDLL